MNRICYQENITKGEPQPLTQDIWNELIHRPAVKNVCAAIASLDPNAENFNDRKQALKKRLPIIIPHACRFEGDGKRKSANAVPSGLAMLDIDHIDNPHQFFAEHILPAINPTATYQVPADLPAGNPLPLEGVDSSGMLLNQVVDVVDLTICLVAVTASGHGLRIIGERLPGESIEAAQLRIATALSITEYDAVTKDLARASYVVPSDYILYINTDALFSAPATSQVPAVPTAGDPASTPYTLHPTPASSPTFTEDSADELKASASGGNLLRSTMEQGGTCADNEINKISAPTGQGDMSYRGLNYSDIVSQLLIAIGNCGGAEIGERNTVYFTLASYMRYICDFNPDLLLRVLPDFGLSVQERRQVISSAIGRPRKAQIPLTLQSAIAICEKEHSIGTTAKVEKSTDLPLPELPRLLRLICKRLPADYQPAMIIAALPVLGTLATRIRFEYLDRQEHSLSFFSCITAPAASGKSFIRKPLDLLLTPINEQDAIEREKEQAYKEKMRASKNSKNQPEDPHACPRNNGVAISIAKLLQLLTYAEGKHLIGIGEEMDTLVKSERAGVWSQKSDIYRLAFDNAEYGQAYMSDTSFNAHIRVYYNLLLTGTPNSMKRFFKDLENGLATRVCFAQLPDTSFTEIPVFAPYSAADKAEIIRWARQLDAEDGTISCPKVGSVIADWLERKRQQAIDADSHAMDTLRRRAAVIGFRAGMLCFLLENRKYTKIVGDFAEWVAEYVFRNQMELWGEQMELELSGALELISGERGSAASLLALLPQEFTAADLIKLRARKGQSVKTSAISMVLNRWRTNHRIEKISDTTWRKL